ncbi:hypothetical protein [Bifidobacterium sp. ESL0704]|nr:hypothetical protein [Bifidobacterium sp. ESL0704]WEV53291.1 hypothetical protein OZX64_02020 [Bifidobacterium sp. ESL0704]
MTGIATFDVGDRSVGQNGWRGEWCRHLGARRFAGRPGAGTSALP